MVLGKTTLTKMLIGLTEPSSGKIEVKLGEEWVDMSKSGPLNRGRVIPYMGLITSGIFFISSQDYFRKLN